MKSWGKSPGSEKGRKDYSLWKTPSAFSITRAILWGKIFSRALPPCGEEHCMSVHSSLSVSHKRGNTGKVVVQELRSTEKLRFNHKSVECFSFPTPYQMPTVFQCNNSGLLLKRVQDTDSFSGGILREVEGQQGRNKRGHSRDGSLRNLQLQRH